MISPEAIEVITSPDTAINIIATLLGGAAAIGALSFAIPTIADKLQPPPKQDRLGDYLPFMRILPNGRHIACLRNRYIAMMAIGGAELTLAPFSDPGGNGRTDLYIDRKFMLDEAHKFDIEEIKLFQIKYESDTRPSADHPNPLMEKVIERWQQNFTKIFNLRTVAMIIIKANNDDEAVEKLEKAETFFMRALQKYQVTPMVENREDLASGPLAALAKIISPISRPTPAGINSAENINYLLTADYVSFKTKEKRGIIRFSDGRRDKYACVISIRDCGDKTSELVMKNVMATQAEMIIYQAIRPHDPAADTLKLRIERANAPFMRLSTAASYEIDDVLRLVEGQEANNRTTLHDYALNIIVFGNTVQELVEAEGHIVGSLMTTGATTVRENVAAQATWFSMFPADPLWPRKFRYLSDNVAAHMYLQRPNEGMMKSDWGDRPAGWFRTIDGQPYALQFHASSEKEAVGHSVAIGPTGIGKALDADSMILTNEGSRKIRNLAPGQEIYGEDGELHRVTGVYPQGVTDRYEITFSDGRSEICSSDHIWTLFAAPDFENPFNAVKVDRTLAEIIKERDRAVIHRLPGIAPPKTYLGLDVAQRTDLLKRIIEDHRQAKKLLIENDILALSSSTAPKRYILEIRPSDARFAVDIARSLGLYAFTTADDANHTPGAGPYAVIDTPSEGITPYLTSSIDDAAPSASEIYEAANLLRALADAERPSDKDVQRLKTLIFALSGQTHAIADDEMTAETYDAFTKIVANCLYDLHRRPEIVAIRQLPAGETVCIKVDNPTSLFLTSNLVPTHNTVFITFLAMQASAIPNLRTYFFDRLNGCESYTRCAKGDYILFDGDQAQTQMNPFLLKDTPPNRAFLRRWLRLIGNAQNANDDAEISRAIETVFDPNLKPEHKSLKRLHLAMFDPTGTMRQNLTPWVEDGQYGNYFNSLTDSLDLRSNRVVGLDMTTVLNDPKLAPPVVDYLIHRIRSVSFETGDPSFIFIDETAPMLNSDSKFSRDFVAVGLREGRKARQVFCLAFQTPDAITSTDLGDTIRQQCQTVFFFRNPNARIDDYRDWGLNDAELDFVLGREYRNHKYAVLVKKFSTGESVILDIDLGILGKYMKIFQSGRPAVMEMHRCIQKYGKNNWVEPYLNGELALRA